METLRNDWPETPNVMPKNATISLYRICLTSQSRRSCQIRNAVSFRPQASSAGSRKGLVFGLEQPLAVEENGEQGTSEDDRQIGEGIRAVLGRRSR